MKLQIVNINKFYITFFHNISDFSFYMYITCMYVCIVSISFPRFLLFFDQLSSCSERNSFRCMHTTIMVALLVLFVHVIRASGYSSSMSALAARMRANVALSVEGVLAFVAFGNPSLGGLPYIITPASSG